MGYLMGIANLTLRFVLELAGVAALAYSGLQLPGSIPLRIAAAVAAPLVFVVVWARAVAPRAANGLSQPRKDLIGTALLLAAAAALAMAGQPMLGIGFAVLVVLNAIGLFALRGQADAVLGGRR